MRSVRVVGFAFCLLLAPVAGFSQTTTPAASAQAASGTAHKAPARKAAANTAPGSTAPGKAAPGKAAPGKTTSGKATSGRTTSGKAGPAKKLAAKKVPVVKPRHGGAVRRPVHPKAPAQIPAAKPVVKPPPKPPAKPAVPANIGGNTGLPLPRYASLKTDDINMRSGPGARYPVQWTYKRRELPVRIEREFDVWRLVEDMDGIKGWVNGATLTGRRTFVVTGTDPRALRAEASDDSDAVAMLKPGVVGRIKSCDAAAAWCQVQAGGYRGFLQRNAFWGTDTGEAITP